jgi:hypothetical protein
MWRSPSGKQQVRRADTSEDVTALEELLGGHADIVADIECRVKLLPAPGRFGAAETPAGYPLPVSKVPSSTAGRFWAAASAIATIWFARSVWRRHESGEGGFTGSADSWPPVMKAVAKDKPKS